MQFNALSLAVAYDLTCSLRIDEVHSILDAAVNGDEEETYECLAFSRVSYIGTGDTLWIGREHFSSRSVESTVLSGVGTLTGNGPSTHIHMEYRYDIGMTATILRILFYSGIAILTVFTLNVALTRVPISQRRFAILVAAAFASIPLAMFRLFRFEISTFHQRLVNTLRNS